MARRVLLPLTLFVLAAALAGQQPTTPAIAPHARHHRRRHAETSEPAKHAAPKSATALQADLTAKLHAGVLARDAVNAEVAGDTITLTGTVHRAENKGQATRLARLVAAHDGWPQAHVFNRIEVN